MEKIKLWSVNYSFVDSGRTRSRPRNIYFRKFKNKKEVEVIERGRVIDFDGNKGIIFDLRYDCKYSNTESFAVSVFWFSGPFEKLEGSKEYKFQDFLKFIGWELEA